MKIDILVGQFVEYPKKTTQILDISFYLDTFANITLVKSKYQKIMEEGYVGYMTKNCYDIICPKKNFKAFLLSSYI